MAKVQIPIVQEQDEQAFRLANKGAYILERVDPETGEIVKENRFTRFEYPDPVPLELPTALRMPESTDQRIRRLVAEQRAWEAYANRMDETFDDWLDNNPEEDLGDFISRHEMEEDARFLPRWMELQDSGGPIPDDDDTPLTEPPVAPE